MTVEAAAAVRLRAQLVRSSSAAVPLRSLCDTATGRGDSNTRHRTYIAINMRINVYIASCIIDTGQAALTHAQITQAITWRTVQPQDEDDSDDDVDINPAHYLQIAGPATTTFPSPDGWTTVQPSKTITNLTHLTIPIITQHYTIPHTQNTRPNCEKGWASTDPTEHRPNHASNHMAHSPTTR